MSKRFDAVITKARQRRPFRTPESRKAIREAARLSQGEIAEVVGVSRCCIWLWETGRREPQGTARDTYFALLDRLRHEVLTP